MRATVLCRSIIELKATTPLAVSHLNLLFSHSTPCVHVREFLSPSHAGKLADAVRTRYDNNECSNWRVGTMTGGVESSDVLTLGTPYNVAKAEAAKEGSEAVR